MSLAFRISPTACFPLFFGAGFLVAGALTGCDSGPLDTRPYIECGNGILETGEVCDDFEKYCSADCSSEEGSCGDGIIQVDFGERCEPGGLVSAGGASGEGGAGGGGGASATGDVPHCADSCHPELGYVCDPETNTCGQTGVDPEALVEDNAEAVCEFFTARAGGEGNKVTCAVDGENIDVVMGSVQDCVDELEATPGCTVGEFEQWAVGKPLCEFLFGDKPCFE